MTDHPTDQDNDKVFFDRASARVNKSPQLRPHSQVILYDWPQGKKHWQWVATAPIKEILDWIKSVE